MIWFRAALIPSVAAAHRPERTVAIRLQRSDARAQTPISLIRLVSLSMVALPSSLPLVSLGTPALWRQALASPQEKLEYRIRQGVPLEDQKVALVASVSASCHEVFWFLDGALVWKGSPRESALLVPVPGEHTLSVADDAGRTATIEWGPGSLLRLYSTISARIV